MGFHLCIYGLFSTFSLSFFKDILTNLFSGTLLRKRAGYVIETMQASWRLFSLFHGWYLNYLDGFHVSSYLNLCSTNFILFETVCCSKVIRRKKFFVTTLCSRSFIHRAHGGQWRDEPVDEQEATCELGASYVKKLFGILFSFSKTNIQSPKFASCELGGHHMWRSSLGPFLIQQNQHSVTKVCIMWVGGASYVKKLFGTLFSFSKTNIQSPKFASF